MTMTSDLRQTIAGDGTALTYEVVGDGAPVVFLHGGYISRYAWNRQRDELGRSFRLILRDLRGHDGAPSVAPPGYSFDATEVEDLLAVLDAEGIERAHLVGHSTGGAIAVAFARCHPDRVARMVLIEPSLLTLLPPDVRASLTPRTPPELAWANGEGPMAMMRVAMASFMGEGWETRISPRALARLEAMAPIAFAHTYALFSFTLTDDDLRALTMPMLCLYGDRSMDWRPLISARIGAVRPDVERRLVAGAGHNVHSDQAATVYAAIHDFLSDTPSV